MELRRTIRVLQGGRAVAALAVVVHHGAVSTHHFVEPLPPGLFSTLNLGFLGVDFFFVLSGFIILTAHIGDGSGFRPAVHYMKKRISRIYTPYIPISFALILLYTALPSVSQGHREWSLLSSLTLLPTGAPPALSVAWTLVHEMVFYSVFLISYFTRYFSWVVLGWICLIAGTALLGIQPEASFAEGLFRTLLAPINIEFVAGMVAALAVRSLSPRLAFPFLAVGVSGMLAYFCLFAHESGRVVFGVSVAFVVAALVWLEARGKLVTPEWLVVLGNASYAIYLVHNPLASIAARLCGRDPILDLWPIGLVVCVGFGVTIGLLYHRLYEKRALQILNPRHRNSLVRDPSPERP